VRSNSRVINSSFEKGKSSPSRCWDNPDKAKATSTTAVITKRAKLRRSNLPRPGERGRATYVGESGIKLNYGMWT